MEEGHVYLLRRRNPREREVQITDRLQTSTPSPARLAGWTTNSNKTQPTRGESTARGVAGALRLDDAL
jgi:hypothetical protein